MHLKKILACTFMCLISLSQTTFADNQRIYTIDQFALQSPAKLDGNVLSISDVKAWQGVNIQINIPRNQNNVDIVRVEYKIKANLNIKAGAQYTKRDGSRGNAQFLLKNRGIPSEKHPTEYWQNADRTGNITYMRFEDIDTSQPILFYIQQRELGDSGALTFNKISDTAAHFKFTFLGLEEETRLRTTWEKEQAKFAFFDVHNTATPEDREVRLGELVTLAQQLRTEYSETKPAIPHEGAINLENFRSGRLPLDEAIKRFSNMAYWYLSNDEEQLYNPHAPVLSFMDPNIEEELNALLSGIESARVFAKADATRAEEERYINNRTYILQNIRNIGIYDLKKAYKALAEPGAALMTKSAYMKGRAEAFEDALANPINFEDWPTEEREITYEKFQEIFGKDIWVIDAEIAFTRFYIYYKWNRNLIEADRNHVFSLYPDFLHQLKPEYIFTEGSEYYDRRGS